MKKKIKINKKGLLKDVKKRQDKLDEVEKSINSGKPKKKQKPKQQKVYKDEYGTYE